MANKTVDQIYADLMQQAVANGEQLTDKLLKDLKAKAKTEHGKQLAGEANNAQKSARYDIFGNEPDTIAQSTNATFGIATLRYGKVNVFIDRDLTEEEGAKVVALFAEHGLIKGDYTGSNGAVIKCRTFPDGKDTINKLVDFVNAVRANGWTVASRS